MGQRVGRGGGGAIAAGVLVQRELALDKADAIGQGLGQARQMGCEDRQGLG